MTTKLTILFLGCWHELWVLTSPSYNILQSWFGILCPAFWHHRPGTKDHYLTKLPNFLKNVHGEGMEDGKAQKERASMPTAPTISAWGCFGAGANSSQAHGPFATPRHEQIEEHSPFPAPYMEQISAKQIIQPEGVIQIIPNRHDGGMLCWNPLIWHSWIDSNLPNIRCIRQLCMRSYSRQKATVQWQSASSNHCL